MKTLKQKITEIVRVTYFDDDANLEEAVESIMKEIEKENKKKK